MKKKLLLSLALCTSLQFSITLGSEASPTLQWFRDKANATYDYAASWIPISIRDKVKSWNTKYKIAVASAIIASLAAIYNKDAIMAMFNNAIENTTEDTYTALSTPAITGTPEEYAQRVALDEKSRFNYKVEDIMKMLGNTDNTGIISATHGQLRDLYLDLHPGADKDPAFIEAIRRLENEQGVDFNF
jgi:hypothetical protein